MPEGISRRAFGQAVAAAALGVPVRTWSEVESMQPGADDLCYSSAVELVSLMRQKQVSARDVMAAHLAQIERVNPKVNAIVTLVAERAMADAARADESLARGGAVGRAARAAGRAQGPGGHGRHPHDAGLAVLSRLRADARCAPRHAHSRGGRRDARQDEHAGVRRRVADVQHGLRRDAESLRRRQDVRRQQRRRRGGAGLRDGAHRRRQRHRRVAAEPGGVLQRRRLPAVAGPRSAGVGIVVAAVGVGPDGALGGRCRALPERDRGTGSARVRSSIQEDGARFGAPLGRDFKGVRVAWWRGLGGIPFEPEIRARGRREPPVFEDLGCIVEEAEPDFAGVDEAFATLRYAANHPQYAAPGARAARVGEGHHQVRGRAGRAAHRAPTSGGRWRGRRGCTTRAAQFFERYDYFVLPVTQVAPFDVTRRTRRRSPARR